MPKSNDDFKANDIQRVTEYNVSKLKTGWFLAGL